MSKLSVAKTSDILNPITGEVWTSVQRFYVTQRLNINATGSFIGRASESANPCIYCTVTMDRQLHVYMTNDTYVNWQLNLQGLGHITEAYACTFAELGNRPGCLAVIHKQSGKYYIESFREHNFNEWESISKVECRYAYLLKRSTNDRDADLIVIQSRQCMPLAIYNDGNRWHLMGMPYNVDNATPASIVIEGGNLPTYSISEDSLLPSVTVKTDDYTKVYFACGTHICVINRDSSGANLVELRTIGTSAGYNDIMFTDRLAYNETANKVYWNAWNYNQMYSIDTANDTLSSVQAIYGIDGCALYVNDYKQLFNLYSDNNRAVLYAVSDFASAKQTKIAETTAVSDIYCATDEFSKRGGDYIAAADAIGTTYLICTQKTMPAPVPTLTLPNEPGKYVKAISG